MSYISPIGAREQQALKQLFISGPVSDEDLVSKSALYDLLEIGYVKREGGYSFVTELGVREALKMGLDLTKRHAEIRTAFVAVYDHDGHEYVIPRHREPDWHQWLDLPSSDERSHNAPDFATAFEGDLVFYNPVIDGRVVKGNN